MEELFYPSKKFLKKSMAIIDNDNDLKVIINAVRKREPLVKALKKLSSDDAQTKLTWIEYVSMFRFLKFAGLCFCALGAGYSISYSESSNRIDVFYTGKNREK